MLLIQFPLGGATRYISNEMCTLTHSWEPYIVAFSPPSWQMAEEHGGMVRFGGGSITISNDLFVEVDIWPPPVQVTLTCQYTESTEEAAITLFTAQAHLVDYDNEEVRYDIRDPEYAQKLLREGTDYNENDVCFPRAFGTVTHVQPIRIADNDDGQPTYDLGGVSTTTIGHQILGFTAVSEGVTLVTTEDAHGFSNGNEVYIEGSDNFDGIREVSNVSTYTFTIPVTFAEETMPIYCQAFAIGSFSVYESGVSIQSNVILNGDGTFSLSAKVEGSTITVIGTGSETTVDEVASTLRTELGITDYVNTYARSPSPAVNRWETSQQTITDFLKGLCASFTHLFYIADDVLTLLDMYRDNGSRTLKESQFFKSPIYSKPNPVKKLTSTWNTYSSEVGFVNDDGSGGQQHYIKTNEHKKEELLYEYGDEMSIEPYHDLEPNVQSALICARVIYEQDRATISIPISATMPVPGEKISWTDLSMPVDIPGYIRTRDIEYDFLNDEIKISGEGAFIRTDRDSYLDSETISGASTEIIDSLNMALGRGAVWRYVIDDGSRTNMRVGVIQAVWDQAAGGNIKMMPDDHSDDIGTTLGVITFAVTKAATIVRLQATSTGGDWTIYFVRTILGASF